MSNYVIDFEFCEDGRTIEPISMGLVCVEDKRELYLQFPEAFKQANRTEWLRKNVRPYLKNSYIPATRARAAADIVDFVGDDPEPRFWAYYAAYDWVAFCQLFGTMMDLPKHFPKLCLDMQQEWLLHRSRLKKPADPTRAHHALADAQWGAELLRALDEATITPRGRERIKRAEALVRSCRPFITRAALGTKPHEQDAVDAKAIEERLKAEFPKAWES